jgi:hypothetical protein
LLEHQDWSERSLQRYNTFGKKKLEISIQNLLTQNGNPKSLSDEIFNHLKKEMPSLLWDVTVFSSLVNNSYFFDFSGSEFYFQKWDKHFVVFKRNSFA